MAYSNLTWPTELPQQLLIDGYDERPLKFKVRTEMDAAIAKQRPRFSTGAQQFAGRMIMTDAQYTKFKDFYNNTLMMGNLEFNMPVRGNSTITEVVRFTDEEYHGEPLGIHWNVILNLERIP